MNASHDTPLAGPPAGATVVVAPGAMIPGAPVASAEDRAHTHYGWRGVAYEIARTPMEFFEDIRYKINHLPQVNFELAQRMAAEGRVKDAIFRYKVALWLAPGHQMSWYYLGTCYLALGEKKRALQAFARSYQLNTHHEETIFMLATIDPKVLPAAKRPAIMPRAIASEYFDRMAPSYDANQNAQRYRAHIEAEDGLRDFIDTRRINHHLLDLGCGTGLIGALTARYTERTVGIDISRVMLERALERRREDDSRVYTETYHDDMRFFLADANDQFEVATAVHVFNYMGDVSSVFDHVSKLLVDNGIFLFQYEPYGGNGYGMIPEVGRFGHSEAYIEGLVAKAGFTTLKKHQIEAYPHYPIWQQVVIKARPAEMAPVPAAPLPTA